MLKSTTERYGSVWKTIHWLSFLVIAGIFGFAYFGVFKWHIALGVLSMALIVLRILWKMYDVHPELPLTVSKLNRFGARGVQQFLYFFMIFMPLSGWFMVNIKGYDVNVLGLFKLPKMVEGMPQHKAFIVDIHVTIGYTFLVFIGLHLLGAIYHHFIKKDRVLMMMWPFSK